MANEWVDIDPKPAAITPGAIWNPVSGEEAEDYLATRPSDAQSRVRAEALSILARCVDPKGGPATRAGLIVGYVQSGKTTSMAACAAMARDNDFGLVILIAGTSKILLEQSRDRFSDALRLDEADGYRRWESFASPKPGGTDASRIASALATWANASFADDRPTVLITVMKQSSHLRDLVTVLEEVALEFDLTAVPAIIFDDEADQASPNLRRNGAESATYRDLRRIRAQLPWHTFLQYTATPQALLLIDIADEISPDFTCVLEPGPDYVGGQYFFVDHETEFVKLIPANDLGAVDPETEDPPDSLLSALAFFVLGSTASRLKGERKPTQRSMLIHPSQEVLAHANFVRWTKAILGRWKTTLAVPDDPDREALIRGEMETAYRELAKSVADLPPLDEIVNHIPSIVGRLRLEEVNARESKPPEIKWSQAFAWVLVGGTLMDRGFTVEGLCVTYMPRGLGMGNADTLQQRARFFGYKRPYAPYCRAWLEPDVRDAFVAYVEHEESIRKELIRQVNAGGSLRDWRRQFILDSSLQPTRRQVIRLPYDRPRLEGWIDQDHLVAPDSNLNDENRTVVEAYLKRITLAPEIGVDPRRTPIQRHSVGTATVGDLRRHLLAPYAFYEGNSSEFRALQLRLDAVDPDEEARVFLMSQGQSRERTLIAGTTKIANLMQGRNPKEGPAIYPGDREMKDEDRLTIQIHWVNVMQPDNTILQAKVPALAVWVPTRLSQAMLIGR